MSAGRLPSEPPRQVDRDRIALPEVQASARRLAPRPRTASSNPDSNRAPSLGLPHRLASDGRTTKRSTVVSPSMWEEIASSLIGAPPALS